MIGSKTLFAIAFALAAVGCKKDDAGASKASSNRIAIAVTEKGFEPDDIKVTKGQPVTFVFERKTDDTCTKEVIIHVDDSNKIEKELPLNQQVEVAVTFPKSGDVRYACGMSMVTGSMHVE